MASLLTVSPRAPLPSEQKYFEMPKKQKDQTKLMPTRTPTSIQPPLPAYNSAPKQNPDFNDPTPTSVKKPLVKPTNHLSQMSIQLGNSVAQVLPGQPISLSPANSEPPLGSLQRHLLHQSTAMSDSKLIDRRTEVEHKKGALTMDLG